MIRLQDIYGRATISQIMPSRNSDGGRRAAKESDYRALAEFRYHIRRYLEFSDQAAKAARIEPKQYQLLLALKGLDDDVEPTVGALAEQLRSRHHSTVELINRAEANRLVERSRSGNRVFITLTARGEKILRRAVDERLEELRVAGPLLVKALQLLSSPTGKRRRKARH